MKQLRIIAAILIGVFVILSSGIVDATPLMDIPYFIQAPEGLILGMGLVVGDIVSEYGAYYEKSKQNKSRVRNLLMQPTVSEKYMTPIKTDDTIFKLANGVIDDIVQPFQKAFTEKGDVTFTPNPLTQYHFKVDFEVYPDDIEATWLGFLASNNLSRKEWPIVRFIIEEYIMKKLKDNMELKEIYKGVYAAPDPGSAGATGTGMNGIGYMLQSGVDTGTINHITLATLTSSNIFDEVEKFVDGISEIYQGIPMNVFMDNTRYKWYMRDKRSQGFYQKSSDKDFDNGIDFTPQKVVSLPSMAGQSILFATPKSNFIHTTKKSVNKTKVKIEESKRVVIVMTDWWEGVGFGVNEAVWTSLESS